MTAKLRHPPVQCVTRAEAVSLKEYVDSRFESMEKAVETAKYSLDVRLESMNEFRKQISEQTGTFMRKDEYLIQHNAVLDKIDALQKTWDDRFIQIGKQIQNVETIRADIQGRIVATGAMIGVVVVLVQVLLHVFWGK